MRSSLDSLLDAPATIQLRLMQSGVVKPSAILEGYIARVHQNDRYLNAVVDHDFEGARRRAAELDQLSPEQRSALPLYGLSASIKEFIATRGLSWTAGMTWRREMKAQKDADIVATLRKAGAIPFIASNGPEGGLWLESDNPLYGSTRNPWSKHRTPGGSSGGEGALVAAACASFGIGSDVGGSIRIPAAFCGIFGHKPSSQLISTQGHYPAPVGELAKYLCVGPMTRSAEDLTLIMQTLAPQLYEAENQSQLKAFYVADSSSGVRADPGLLRGLENAADALEASGLERRSLPNDIFKDAVEIWLAMMSLSGSPEYSRLLGQRPISPLRELLKFPLGRSTHSLPALLVALAEGFSELAHGRLEDFRAKGQQLKEELDQLLGNDAIILHPPYSRPAPLRHSPWLTPFHFGFTALFNVTEHPVSQVPVGLSKGLPIGVQVIAPHGYDNLALSAASIIESSTGGWLRPPLAEVA
jgi:fatty acid amide hydrolase 2